MLSISTLRSVNYYTERVEEVFSYNEGRKGAADAEVDPRGVWVGELAQRMGLRGTARLEEFAALYFGIEPATGKHLVKNADQEGFDIWRMERQLKAMTEPDARRVPTAQLAAMKVARKTIESARESADAIRKELNDAPPAEHKALEQSLRLQEKIAGPKRHRPGVDLTFTLPKSFSILVASANPDERKKLLAWAREAVQETMEDIERDYAQTRREVGGKIEAENVKGLACAVFEHVSARPVGDNAPDPDVHFHCLAMSPTLAQDDKIRALFSDRIARNIKALGAQARARLAQRMKAEGYHLVADEQKKILSWDLAGVGKDTKARFSKRRSAILDAIGERTESGQATNAQVATLATREGKGDWTRQDCIEAWSAELGRLGLSAGAIKSAHADPLRTRQGRTNEEIIVSLQEMEAYFSLPELRQKLWENAQFADLNGKTLNTHIAERMEAILKSSDLLQISLPEGSLAAAKRGENPDREPIFTTRSLAAREMALETLVKDMASRANHRVENAFSIIEKTEANKLAKAIADAQTNGTAPPLSWTFRDDQRAAIQQVLEGPDVSFIQAYAGTGKTTIAEAIMAGFRTKGLRPIALAPSNKAARLLAQETGLEKGRDAFTVAKFLHSHSDQIDAKSVLFVDEASMVGFDDAEKLVKLAHEKGARLIFMGDRQQLPSVPRGRFFAECVEKRMGESLAELTTITRQRQEWAKAATEAAAQGLFAEALTAYESRGCLTLSGTDTAQLQAIASDYLADARRPEQKLIITSRNREVDALNAMIRQSLVDKGILDAGHAVMTTTEGKEKRIHLSTGDRVVFLARSKNSSGREQASTSDFGTVLHVAPRSDGSLDLQVQIDDGAVARFNTQDFAELDHAYALSIHKSQGLTVSGARYLVSEFVSSELAYVAMSRHKDDLQIYCLAHQRHSLEKWMGRKIEKFSARDLIDQPSLHDLEAQATARHERDKTLMGRIKEAALSVASAPGKLADSASHIGNRATTWATTKISQARSSFSAAQSGLDAAIALLVQRARKARREQFHAPVQNKDQGISR